MASGISPADSFGDTEQGHVLPILSLMVFLGSDVQKKTIFALHVLSILGSFGLAATFIFSKLTRHSSIINYLCLNATLSIVSSFCVFSVSADQLGHRASAFAVFQAAITMSGCWAVALGDILLALLMLSKISRPGSWSSNMSEGRVFTVVVVGLPWAVWVVTAIVIAVIGSMHRRWVQYISYWYGLSPALFPWLFSLLAMFSVTVLLDLILLYYLFVHTRRRNHLDSQPSSQDPTPSTHFQADETPTGKRSTPRRPVALSQSRAERMERLKWAALGWRIGFLGAFFLCNAVMIGLVVKLKLNANVVLCYEASRGLISSFILASQFDVLQLYGTTLLSLVPCLRRKSTSRNPSSRQGVRNGRSSSAASITGPSLSYSNASLDQDQDQPLGFSKPHGSLVDISGSQDNMYELKGLGGEEGGEDRSVSDFEVRHEGRGLGGDKKRTSDRRIHVQVEVERHEGTSFVFSEEQKR